MENKATIEKVKDAQTKLEAIMTSKQAGFAIISEVSQLPDGTIRNRAMLKVSDTSKANILCTVIKQLALQPRDVNVIMSADSQLGARGIPSMLGSL